MYTTFHTSTSPWLPIGTDGKNSFERLHNFFYSVFILFLLDYMLPFVTASKREYTCTGTCQFPNIMENIEQNVFPVFPLSTSIAGSNSWLFTLVSSEEDDETYIWPYIFMGKCPKLGVSYLFEIKTKSSYKYEGKCITDEDEGVYGRGIKVTDLENGYLKNGELSIDYGIQVESVQENQIWKFNLQDEVFGHHYQINLTDDMTVYSHKQPFVFHSWRFKSGANNIKPGHSMLFLGRNFNKFVQIANGVRVKYCDAETLFAIIPIAQNYGFRNVVRYCEQELIVTCPFDKNMTKNWIVCSIRFNLRHLLAKILRESESLDDLKLVLKRKNIRIPREIMKMCLNFLIELS